jgi:hypothetical protein
MHALKRFVAGDRIVSWPRARGRTVANPDWRQENFTQEPKMTRVDHDQRFKTLIQEFFAEFLSLFFPQWAERFDCSAAEWLTQEIFPDPPDGPCRRLDLVAKVPRRPHAALPSTERELEIVLVHIEIESAERSTVLRSQLVHDYLALQAKYGVPILPIALYLKVGLKGVGIDVYELNLDEFNVLSFRYFYVGLPALDAVQYVEGGTVLGAALAALMRVPAERRVRLYAEALQRLSEAAVTEQQRFLLVNCVQAYWKIDEDEQAQVDELFRQEPFAKVQVMNKTMFDQGLEKGEVRGQQRLLRRQLEQRFGPLPAAVVERLSRLDSQDLDALGQKVIVAQSLAELHLLDE